jgi:hypothetical protein
MVSEPLLTSSTSAVPSLWGENCFECQQPATPLSYSLRETPNVADMPIGLKDAAPVAGKAGRTIKIRNKGGKPA